MLEKLVKYIVGLGEKQAKTEDKIIELSNGYEYTTLDLKRVRDFEAEPIKINSLIGLVDYLKLNVDNHKDILIVHIHSNSLVSLYSELREDRSREKLILCNAILPEIRFQQFLDAETFNVLLQSCFVQTDTSASLLKVIGNIRDEAVKVVGDDGISQEVTVRKGIQTAGVASVPNPVVLAPFRTFTEIAQPQSKFIFRMQDGPKAGLFEADGGAWRIEAMLNIKNYLQTELDGLNVKIIS